MLALEWNGIQLTFTAACMSKSIRMHDVTLTTNWDKLIVSVPDPKPTPARMRSGDETSKLIVTKYWFLAETVS